MDDPTPIEPQSPAAPVAPAAPASSPLPSIPADVKKQSLPSAAAPAQAGQEDGATPAEPLSRRDALKQALEGKTKRGDHAQYQPRQNGQFAGPPSPPPAPAAGSPSAVPQHSPSRPSMPKSLRKELEAHWNTAHPELAAAIHQRELDYEKGVQPLKEA